MDFMRNLEGKRWWVDGLHGGERTLERGPREGDI